MYFELLNINYYDKDINKISDNLENTSKKRVARKDNPFL